MFVIGLNNSLINPDSQSFSLLNTSNVFVMFFSVDSERILGNSKFCFNNKKDHNLEDFFFELEQQMENNIICRDAVCRKPETEKGN